MAITHVVRGEEWISSTPKHVLLYDWLGWERPAFAHMPLLRNVDKSKISKRKNPAARLTWFVEQGYLPEALVNFLGLLGYSLPDGREVFTFEEMSASFDWTRVNTVGPVFDLDKLAWLNGHYIRELSEEDFVSRMLPFLQRDGLVSDPPTAEQADLLRGVAPLVQTRMAVLSEAPDLVRFLFVDGLALDEAAAAKTLVGEAGTWLMAAAAALAELAEWSAVSIEESLKAVLVEGLGLKPRQAFAPVRLAMSGSPISPPLYESLELLGRDRSIARLRAAAARVDRG
jgi:glutamyl-tRNA synthetase